MSTDLTFDPDRHEPTRPTPRTTYSPPKSPAPVVSAACTAAGNSCWKALPGSLVWIRTSHGVVAGEVLRVETSIATVIVGHPGVSIDLHVGLCKHSYAEAFNAPQPIAAQCPLGGAA